MRLPRVEFTVRRLMVAVAIVALILGTAIGFFAWMDRRKHYAYHRSYDLIWEIGHDEIERSEMVRRGATESELSRIEELRKWHKGLHEKYFRIYRHPWIPAWPDPPEPNPGRNTERLILK